MEVSFVDENVVTRLLTYALLQFGNIALATLHLLSERKGALLRINFPLEVYQIRIYQSSRSSYSLCPNCLVPLEREYVNYCSFCGQRLSWTLFNIGIVEVNCRPSSFPTQIKELRYIMLHKDVRKCE